MVTEIIFCGLEIIISCCKSKMAAKVVPYTKNCHISRSKRATTIILVSIHMFPWSVNPFLHVFCESDHLFNCANPRWPPNVFPSTTNCLMFGSRRAITIILVLIHVSNVYKCIYAGGLQIESLSLLENPKWPTIPVPLLW